MPCAWLVVAFDSDEQDERDYLKTEYGGLTLHIKPGHGDEVSRISTFLEDNSKHAAAQLVINRFLSAMAWKEGKAFITLGSILSGALPTDREKPRFNWLERRVVRYSVISRFDFEHLQNPPEDRQKLALALYREGLGSNMDFYSFLSFYKIINIRYANGHEKVAWISANLDRMWNHLAQEGLAKLRATIADVGTHLLRQRRDAISHSFSHPILDPDLPTDKAAIKMEVNLMQGLAEVFIEEELGIPSRRKIWREHLYELEGFKAIVGESRAARLKLKNAFL